jgi:hypothetical protein
MAIPYISLPFVAVKRNSEMIEWQRSLVRNDLPDRLVDRFFRAKTVYFWPETKEWQFEDQES